ncbi:hypothetical protein T439DRAFT_251504 [Meredithblackwellia eburnea MCA 4105]
MGPRSGGKSSIRKVVFERMAPSDTLFIEKTTKTVADSYTNSFISLTTWDLPGGVLDPAQWPLTFSDLDAVIFVLDAQGTFLNDMIRKLAITMFKAWTANQGIQFEVFLHKIDGMSEDYRLDTLQNLRDRLTEDLFDLSPELESSMNVFYHLTSVFDTSIYEALSKVVQKLIPEQGMLERLLDILCQQCSLDKAFLFDTSSKLYIATDSAPLETQTYVICSDYLDLIGDFTLLYEPTPVSTPVPPNNTTPTTSAHHSRSSSRSVSTPGGLGAMTKIDSSSGTPGGEKVNGSPVKGTASLTAGRLPSSRVRLGTGGGIAMWGINSNLSLVTLLRPQMMDEHEALIEYNVATFGDAVLAIFDLGMQA